MPSFTLDCMLTYRFFLPPHAYIEVGGGVGAVLNFDKQFFPPKHIFIFPARWHVSHHPFLRMFMAQRASGVRMVGEREVVDMFLTDGIKWLDCKKSFNRFQATSGGGQARAKKS